MSNSSSPNNLVRNSLLAGSTSGMASTIACLPFDVVRVKMQSMVLASTHLGIAGTVRCTIQFDRLRALYSGLALPLAAQALYKGTVFTVNNVRKQAIKHWKTQQNYKPRKFSEYRLSYFDCFVTGFVGDAVNAAFFVTPVEFICNQQIAQTNSNIDTLPSYNQGRYPKKLSGLLSIMRRTLQAEGMIGLWHGAASTVLRDSLGCGCFLTSMSYSQHVMAGHHDTKGPPSKPVLIASGAISGIGFWIVGLPLDTMKTWIQNGSAMNLQHA